MTDENRKAILRRIDVVIRSCENICEDASRMLQDQAKVVAYEHIRAILRGENE